MLSLGSFKFPLLKGGICLVKKYKAGSILHFCNLKLYSEHLRLVYLVLKGDSVQIHTVVSAGGWTASPS